MKKHIPNTITCLNLISGCIATYWAFQGNYEQALLFIIIGAVFDFFDGMVARLLHVSSPIGKELDSLADDITFGFAPSAIVFSFLKGMEAEADSSLFTLHSSLPYLLLAGVFISSYLLIAEIPMFALKFKQWGWKGNEIKYIFILTCVPILLLFGITGIAVIIAWYVILSVITKQSIQKPV